MGFVELLLIGVGLSMDAFAVAVCKGLAMKRVNYRHALVIALMFGGFQALMPLVGWALGTQFEQYITPVDHWIAFVLLAFIGGKMLWEALRGEAGAGDGAAAEGEARAEAAGTSSGGTVGAGTEAAGTSGAGAAVAGATGDSGEAWQATGEAKERLDMRELVLMAIATSIDALAVGITFAFLQVDIVPAVTLIGATTFVLSLGGVVLGNQFGARFEKPASVVGGVVLILIGLKILLEHLGIIAL